MSSNLTRQDIYLILKCLPELYAACNLEAFSANLLALLPEAVSSEVIGIAPILHRTNLISLSRSNISSSAIDLPRTQELIRQHFLEHPVCRNYLQTGNMKAQKISDFLSQDKLHRLETVYGQYMKLLGMEYQISVVLSVPAKSNYEQIYVRQTNDLVIALQRSSRDFSERDRFVLNLLRPHLIQAYQNAIVFTQKQHEAAQLNHTIEQLGLITLSETIQIHSMSQRAEELLTQYFPSATCQRNVLPETLQGWVNHQLSLMACSDDVIPPCLPLQVEQEGRRLTVRLICDRQQGQYLLLLEEQPPRSFSPESLEMLGLTRREAEVLFWGAKDKSTKEIALNLNCSTKTIEKHFENIYEKLGVRTRVAAIFMALEKLGMID